MSQAPDQQGGAPGTASTATAAAVDDVEIMVALMRDVSPSMASCELTHIHERIPIDVAVAQSQHDQCAAVLREQGVRVVSLPAQDSLPDAVFVEDCVLVLDECVIALRSGAASRRPEVASVVDALRPYRPADRFFAVEEPGTVDGGDIIVFGRTILIGTVDRSNAAGVAQIAAFVAPFHYTVRAVTELRGCLHLKSAATRVGPMEFLVNPDRLDPQVLQQHLIASEPMAQLSFIHTDPTEPDAGNALWVPAPRSPLGAHFLVYGQEHPRTLAKILAAFEASGRQSVTVRTVPTSELAKAEGAVTCCSVVFRWRPSSRAPSPAAAA